MILTVDIGNSRIKWASWQAGVIVARGVADYQVESVAEVLKTHFSILEKPERVYVVCVADKAVAESLTSWCAKHWQIDAEYLKTNKKFSHIVNAYEDPEKHGADRWAAVVASHLSHPELSVCVICAGTAMTFDLVASSGVHLGGYILPSYNAMHSALMKGTARVASTATFDACYEGCGIPNNTDDAVNQGLHKLLQAGIRDICRLAQDELDAPLKIIVTGGFAKTILAYPDMPAMQHEPDLIMQGLYKIMSQKNKVEK